MTQVSQFINEINNFYYNCEKLKFRKLMFILYVTMYNTWDKFILSNVYLLCELLLIISKLADIILFSLVIQYEIYTINGKFVILFIVNYFLKLFLSQNNKFAIKYISTIQNKIDFLRESNIENKENIKDFALDVTKFIKSIPNVIKSLLWVFEIILINIFLVFNKFYYEIIVINTGIIIITFLTNIKYIYLAPHINAVNKKTYELTFTDKEEFIDEYTNVSKTAKLIYYQSVKFSVLNSSVTAFVLACIFILGLFQNEVPEYLNFWKLICYYLLTESLETYVSEFIDDLPTFCKICDLYDTLAGNPVPR